MLGAAIEMLRDLEEFERSGGRVGVQEAVTGGVCAPLGRSGLDEAPAAAMMFLLDETLGTDGPLWKHVLR
jgi:hypothetical protein